MPRTLRWVFVLVCWCLADGKNNPPAGHQGVELAPVCENVDCPALRCPKKLQVKNATSCCAECYCQLKGQTIEPGSFCEKGRLCVCEDGKVQCSNPDCPVRSLDCVDYDVGADCCFHCPNGQTCQVPGGSKNVIVIRAGEYKVVKNNVCTCAGDPWYPYAFCAPKSVAKSLTKDYGEMLQAFMEV